MCPMPSGQHAEERAWLVFRLGPHLLCASALEVEGIIEPVRPRPVPFTPPYVLGWFDFRGRVASVVSLRRKFGVLSGEDGAAGPYVVAQVQGDLAAFWVDEVRDVLESHQASWQPMPVMPGASIFDRYVIRDAEVILHTTFAALLRADAVTAFPAVAEAQPQAAPVVAPAPEPEQPPPVEQAPQRAAPESEPKPPPAPARPRAEPRAPRSSARPLAPQPEAPRPAPGPRRAVAAPARAPEQLPMEAPPVIPRSYEAQDFEIDAGDSPRAGAGRWSRSVAVPAVLALLVAVAVLAWLLYGVAERPPAAPVVATGPLVPSAPSPAPAPASTRIATIRTDAFTLTVDRPAKPAPAPAARPNPEREDGRITHVVVRGDTLSHIAQRYLGDGARYPELARLSRIRDPDLIHPGDIVTIDKAAPPRR